MDHWPAFLPNQVITGSLASNVAIICGWTTKDKTLRDLKAQDPHILNKVAAIGNLYSAERGIDMVLRNILAHPFINVIIFTGKDISGAAADFVEFLHKTDRDVSTKDGKDAWYFEGTNIRIGADIQKDTLTRLRKSLTFIEVPSIGNVPPIVDNILKAGIKVREPDYYPPPRPDADSLPAPRSLHPIRVNTIPEGYLELLYQIMTFGHTIDTHYDQASKELMNLAVVIENEPPPTQDENFAIIPSYPLPDYIPFDLEHLSAYVSSLIAGKRDDAVTYNYGHLMRHHFGKDQMMEMAKKLAREPDSRSAVISLWDPNIEKSSPCLNHIWLRILDGKLFMTCIIRSNDMLYGWPENAYGMRALQEWMRCTILKMKGAVMDDNELALGDLTIISQSAHIYEDGWQPALDIVDQFRRNKTRFDPKGCFVFEDTGNPIGERKYAPDQYKVQLVGPSGEVALEFTAPSTKNIRREIDKRRLISDVGHALWIGYELGKMGSAKKAHQPFKVDVHATEEEKKQGVMNVDIEAEGELGLLLKLSKSTETLMKQFIGKRIGEWEISFMETNGTTFTMQVKHVDTGEEKTISAHRVVWRTEGIKAMVEKEK